MGRLHFILFYFILFVAAPTMAQDRWQEPFTLAPGFTGSRDIDTKHWQYIIAGPDSVSFTTIRSERYSKKFIELRDDVPDRLGNETNAWVRYRIANTFNEPMTITFPMPVDLGIVYIGDKGSWKKFITGYTVPWNKRSGIRQSLEVIYTIPANTEVTVYNYLKNINKPYLLVPVIKDYRSEVKDKLHNRINYSAANVISACFFGFILFAVVFNLLFYYVNRERVYLVYSATLLLAALYAIFDVFSTGLFYRVTREAANIYEGILVFFLVFMVIHTLRLFFRVREHYPRWDKFLLWVPIFLMATGLVLFTFRKEAHDLIIGAYAVLAVLFMGAAIIGNIIMIVAFLRRKNKEARLFVLAALPFFLSIPISMFVSFDWVVLSAATWAILVLSWGMFARFKNLQIENARVALEKEEERSRLIAQQNEVLEQQVTARTAELTRSLTELKLTQNQLIQSEKMASLGELTAGIAHEIQNPLNFVNNFSDVSRELLDEMEEELDKGDTDEAKAIAGDIKQNLEKIAHHGRRADGIVKGMLQHSRASSGQKEPTDINALADEYLRLAYHGLRAKDKSFNAELVTDLDPALPLVSIIPQDVGRVLLNLFTNAFYATQEKSKQLADGSFKPTVTVTTHQKGDTVEIVVKDNGTGIPDAIKDKILQPFFTTKPTGEGTGLGLSLSYDIVVKGHGGTININSEEGKGSEFIITLPVGQ